MPAFLALLAGLFATATATPTSTPTSTATATANRKGREGEPWDGPALSADPRAMLAAADALPPAKGGVDVLLEEGVYRFDARGEATFTYRLVFRPLSQEAARGWARVERPWAPWYQARPEIRARVITAPGEVHDLDPATLSEAGAGGENREIFTDRRMLAGPLPAVRAGTIVEEVATVRDTVPLFEAGTSYRFWFGQANPIRLARLRIEAPPSLDLRWIARGADLKPAQSTDGGLRVLVFERRDLPPVALPEPFAPHDALPGPYVGFGTGRSWGEIAARYGALADRQLTGSDLAALAREVAGERPTLADAARKLTAWLHRNVRYTGLELGESAIVPARAAEVLDRRYGDCKDLSLLLAGLLRAAGFDARIALLRVRWADVDRELPGVGAFDHAIVVVPGRNPLWIDPSDPYTPPGRLPPPDQGRFALVTGAGTRDLVRTPEPRPDENRMSVVRELRLAELGKGDVVETRTVDGAFAAEERAGRDRIPPERRRELAERMAKEIFRAEELAGEEVTGLEDPAAPLRVRVTVRRSAAVVTEDDEARVPVTPDSIFAQLPQLLTGGDDGKEPLRPRKADLLLVEPYRAELIYRLVPPDGFRARPLPAARSQRFGPASYEERYAVDGNGTVTASFRFDTGAGRLSAADADALAREVRRIVSSDGPSVSFERTGAALLAAGRAREALAEIRRLAARHPQEALHRLHLALALLQLGFGAEAAGEARAAIALEPDRGWAHRVLGYVLEHDAVGRLHGPGFDHSGAIAAYRKAKALEPTHAGGRAALAELLATDPSGIRFGPGAKLDEAVAELKAIHDDLSTTEHDARWLATLVAARRDEEAIGLARGMPAGEERNGLLAAAVAARDGAPAALSEVERLGPGDRRKALQQGAGLLVRRRQYRIASELLAAAARSGPGTAELRAQADAFARVRPWEELRAEGDERIRLVRRIAIATLLSPDPARELASFAAERHRAEVERIARQGPVSEDARRVGPEALPRPVLADLLVARLEIAPDGDDRTGWRIRVRVPAGNSVRSTTLYAVKERGELRLVSDDPTVLGDEALGRAERGDLAGARRWLEWGAEELGPGGAGEASPGGVLSRLWTRGEAGDAPRLRRAAAALAAFGPAHAKVLPALEAARAAAADAGERRALGWAIAACLRAAGRDADLLRAADAVLAAEPGSRPAFLAKAYALRKLGRAGEIPAAAEAVLARLPDDPDVLSVVAMGQMEAGEMQAAVRTWRRAVDAGRATPMIYNDAAWLLLWSDPVAPEALEWARRAVEEEQRRNEASLNTLAAVYAALGRPAEAREVLLESISAQGMRPLSDADWLVQGWIAEDLGLEGAAGDAYARVRRPADGDPASPWALVQRRLGRMGKR